MIELKNISFGYDEKPLFKDFSFTAKNGECTAIVGKNGAGKSTLLKIICGVIRPASGDVLIEGLNFWQKRLLRKPKIIKNHATLVGYVMQKPENQLFAETVAKDIAFGPENLGFTKEEIERNVDKWVKFFDIENIRDKSPFKISGGQQRMAAIAGVVAMNTPNICMDEPSASLDSFAVEKIHELVITLKKEGKAVVLVSHDASEVKLLADRIVKIGE